MKITIEFDSQNEHDGYVGACESKRAYVAELEADNNALKHRIQTLNEQIEGARRAVLEKAPMTTTAPSVVSVPPPPAPPAPEQAEEQLTQSQIAAMFGPAPVPTIVAPSVVLAPPPTTVPSPALATAPASTAHIQAIPPNLDVDGLPWDGRIHASTKNKNADGRWKKKRGVGDTFVNEVTAQLRQVMNIPANGDGRTIPLALPPAAGGPALAPLTAAQASQIPWPAREPVAAPPAASSVSALPAPPPPAPPAPPPPSPAVGISTLGDLIAATTARIVTGQLTKEAVEAVLAKYGIPIITLLDNRPDLIPVVARELGLS